MINAVEPLHFPQPKINRAQNGVNLADLLATQPSLLIWTSLFTAQKGVLPEGKMNLYCNLTALFLLLQKRCQHHSADALIGDSSGMTP